MRVGLDDGDGNDDDDDDTVLVCSQMKQQAGW